MHVSEKIQKKINEIAKDDDNLKKLMVDILEEEANGTYKIKIKYEELVNEYIKNGRIEVSENDKNKQD